MFEETVPDRLALMALDASTELKIAISQFRPTVDQIDLPMIIVETGEGDYPPLAAGTMNCEETYTVSILGYKFGTGSQNDATAERQVRRIAAAVIKYLWRRQQLQFSNSRGLQSAALGALDGVEYIHLHRGVTGGMSREGLADTFWGCSITVTVYGIDADAEEVLVFP